MKPPLCMYCHKSLLPNKDYDPSVVVEEPWTPLWFHPTCLAIKQAEWYMNPQLSECCHAPLEREDFGEGGHSTWCSKCHALLLTVEPLP